MKPELYHQLARIDQTHWWLLARRLLARDFLARLELPAGALGLDLGCGTGGNLPLLQEFCARVVGLDVSSLALDLARAKYPDQEFRLGDANRLAQLFPPEHFDLITIFNVLYHDWVSSETEVLAQARTLLKPGGWLLVTEPAFAFLHRRHDQQAMGHRRYTLRQFAGFLAQAGLEVRAGTYFNAVSFLPALALALADRLARTRTGRGTADAQVSELEAGAGWLDRVLLKAMAWERTAVRSLGSIPLGVSLLCLARKGSPPTK